MRPPARLSWVHRTDDSPIKSGCGLAQGVRQLERRLEVAPVCLRGAGRGWCLEPGVMLEMGVLAGEAAGTFELGTQNGR